MTGALFLDWFAESVASDPDAIAVAYEGRELRYRELDARSDALAHRLAACGAGPGTCVVVHAERSAELVIALIAIVKTGAAFVPIDPSTPSARVARLVRAVAPPAIVAPGPLGGELAGLAPHALAVDAAAGPAFAFARPAIEPQSLAYAMFTSGSTGEPKPVAIEHRQLASYVRGLVQHVELPRGARYAIVSTFAADLGYTIVFSALALGGALHVVSRARATDPAALGEYMTRERIDCLKIVPSHLAALVAASRDPAALLPAQRLVLGGEASSARWAHQLRELRPGLRVFNHYGPTETTVGVLTRELVPGWTGDVDRVPLGRPLPGTSAHVLDERARPVPPGEPGELYLGGAQVARGYHGRPAATAERFVPDASGAPGARAYRTGDKVRELPDGALDFLGRVDDQVKVRGYRVEPSEVRAAVCELPSVRDAAIVARDAPDGSRVLVAYVVPRVARSGRHELPNGLAVAHLHRHETDYIYKEVFELQAYLRHGITLRDGACVVDVGANIGLFSLFAASVCRAPAIVAVEPNPAVFALLTANLAAYVPGARALRCGLGAEPGEATFTFFTGYSLLSGFHADAAAEAEVVKAYVANQASAGDRDAAELARHADELIAPRFATEHATVAIRTLSDVIAREQLAHVDLLKINVEKAEVGVLAGLAPRDWQRIDQLVAEIDVAAHVDEIAAMLDRHGFDFVIEQDPLLARTELRYVYATRRGAGIALVRDQPPGAHRVAISPPPAPFLDEAQLLAHCRARLPEYMVPSAFVVLDALPLTANGKLDRHALPSPWAAPQPRHQAGGDTRQRLLAIWLELIPPADIADDDSFFDVGGTSLLAIRLGGRLRDVFGADVPLARIFTSSTLREMAELVTELTAAQ